jgi:hypothetical protein
MATPLFDFTVEGPGDWTVLETAPGRWRRSVAALLEGPAATLPGWVRAGTAAFLEDAVAVAQRAGVLLCLVKAARDEDGRPFLGSLALSWYDSTPLPASPELAAAAAGPGTTLITPLGPALVTRAPVPAPAGWTGLVPSGRGVSVQAFLPVPRTCWTALVAGTVADPAHEPLLTSLVRRMTGSIRPRPATGRGFRTRLTPGDPEGPEVPGVTEGGAA